MATIGPSNMFNPIGSFSGPPQISFNTGSNAIAGGLSMQGPGQVGMGYGRQAMGDIEVIMALMALLQQGSAAPTGDCSPGLNPSSLNAAGAKGGGKSLAKAGAKGASSLRRAGGKGVSAAKSLKKAGGK